MATIVTRVGKGSPLTFSELDSNFTNLNTDKLERNGSIAMTGNLNLNSNSITNVVNFTASGTITGGTFSGSGASLTSLNGSQITTGTVPVARLNGGTTGQFVRGDGAYSNSLIGDFGVGVSPAVRLDVQSASGVEGTIRLTSPIDGSNATPRASSFSFRSGTTPIETARIASFNRIANVAGGDLVFSTADSSNVLQQRAVIDSSGNLGIGTASPLNRLVVSNGSSENFEFSTGSVALNGGAIEYINRATATTRPDFNFYIGTNGSHKFYTNGTERMRLDASGNLGIGGTPTGFGKLDVRQATNFRILFSNNAAYGSNGVVGINDSGAETTLGIGGTPIIFCTQATERMRIASAGNVTINAPTSGTTLALTALSAGTSLTATDGTRAFILAHSGGSVQFGSSSAHDINLISNNTTRIIANAAGNVVINAPSSGTALTVNGITANNAISCTDGTTTFVVQPNATSGTLIGTTTANATRLISNGSIRVDIGSAGNVTINAPGSGVGLTVNGGGIAVTGNSTITGTLGGISTLTATTFSGALSGNATTATTLQTARTLWGQSFDGSANVTGAAALPLASTVDGVAIGYRSIPRSTTTTTATTSDVGKCIAVSANITIPNATFAAGDAVSIYNDSASAITITAGVTTLRQAGTTNTGNRTLAPRGMATIWFNSATEAVISGPGVS